MSTIQLRGGDINGDQTSCTVAQLVIVFETLAKYGEVPDLVWYGADMSPSFGRLNPYGRDVPVRIGSIASVIELLRTLSFPQLDFGVFTGRSPSTNPEVLTQHVSAEGAPRKRSADSQIEVVAFDDIFIEITTDRADILQNLRDRFAGAIVRK
jgi:hypothetical protein